MVATLKTDRDYNRDYIRVKKYFIAWRTYDVSLLRSIFIPSAKYIIRNKERILNGIDEIEQYWQRNKKRQKNIKLRWNIIKAQRYTDEVEFCASFWDEEKCQNIKVNGRIIFKYNAIDQIVRLSEAYRVKLLLNHTTNQDNKKNKYI